MIPSDVYLRSEPSTITWGRLPNVLSRPVMTVASGTAVCFDTISHEGILEDQGRDPAAFFGAAGIGAVLEDAAQRPGPGTTTPSCTACTW